MRTTKEQKIKNYINEAKPEHTNLFDSIVGIQDIYYNSQKTMVVEYATFINDDKTITICRKILIRDADLIRHHKRNLPYDHFDRNIIEEL